MSVNYVVEIIRLNNVLMKENLVWEWTPLVPIQKKKLPDGKSKSVDYSNPQWNVMSSAVHPVSRSILFPLCTTYTICE